MTWRRNLQAVRDYFAFRGCFGYFAPMKDTRAERIRHYLSVLEPAELEITDDSARHAGHAAMKGAKGGETHFNIRIVSPQFAGKNRVQKHRMVQELLQPEFAKGLHAVSIQAELPE